MRYDYLTGLLISCALVSLFLALDGGVCFRKYRAKKSRCKSAMKREFDEVQGCCSLRRAGGYAEVKTKKGRNLYMCIPCRPKPKRKSRKKNKKNKNKEEKKTDGERITEIILTRDDSKPMTWSAWGGCSITCGAGWRYRVKICEGCDKTDPRNMHAQPCIINHYCAVNGNWGPWFPWQPCTSSCGGGIQTRARHCNYPPPSHGGNQCVGAPNKTRDCNVDNCPVDGEWGEWSEFSKCSNTCGRGTKTRNRNCDSPKPVNGGRQCQGAKYEQGRCGGQACPVHGGWSLWGVWSTCPVKCGTGARTRKRRCNTPKPKHGGNTCGGAATDDQRCYSGRQCPVHGIWSEWTSYSPCSAPQCTGKRGFRIRTRSCTNPRPRHGGRYCKGVLFSTIECINDDGCPVAGVWCKWSLWSACLTTCMSKNTTDLAFRRRQRTCECPAPQNGGKRCDDDGTTGFQVEACTDLPTCPVHDVMANITATIHIQVDNSTTTGCVGNSSCEMPNRSASGERTKPPVSLDTSTRHTHRKDSDRKDKHP